MINPLSRLANFREIRHISEEISRFLNDQGGRESAAEKLNEQPNRLFLEFFTQNRANDNRVFELSDDLRLCADIADYITDADTKKDFLMFFEFLAAWKQINIDEFSLLRSTFATNLDDELRNNFHDNANVFIRGAASISADTLEENIKFRGVFALGNPNKMLGKHDELIISCDLRNYLGAVNAMLRTLTLRESERKFVSESFQQKIYEALDQGLARIEDTISNIRDKFVVEPSKKNDELA